METIQTFRFTESRKGRKKMTDYSEYLLRINQLMQMVHKATIANNYQAASDLSAEVARYAISLSALLESKTETEI